MVRCTNNKCGACFFDVETAVPLGLIMSELISNSLKYAFPDDKMVELLVFRESYHKEHKLVINDNGVGFPENLDFRIQNQV